MSFRKFAFTFVVLFGASLPNLAQTKTVAERLGYPADTKLLIIHADDLAIAHSEDAASLEALDKGYVTSASIIVPGPWLTEVADYAKAHPDADLGLHLALTSEWKTFRWGSVESKDKVPSLLDPAGALWPLTEDVRQKAKPQEVEREYRAQVQHALAVGIHPTHLDTHMGSALATPEIVAVYVKIAHEFHLPILAPRIPGDPLKLSALLSEKDVMVDSVTIVGPSVSADKWKDFYLDAIRNILGQMEGPAEALPVASRYPCAISANIPSGIPPSHKTGSLDSPFCESRGLRLWPSNTRPSCPVSSTRRRSAPIR